MNEILINIMHVDDYSNFIIIRNIITIILHYHTIRYRIYVLDWLMHVSRWMVGIICYLIVLWNLCIVANSISNLYMVCINH
jgi:hypothetical protein